jgi:outer membrane protein assembly factor BamA
MVCTRAILLLAVVAVARAQTLVDLNITGNQRLPAAAIAKASGLVKGQSVSKVDLDKATKTLIDTGLFTDVKFQSKTDSAAKDSDWSVTFEIVEERADLPGVLEIPGFVDAMLWQDLKQANGLIEERMPSNKLAEEYYRRAIESFLDAAGHPYKLDVRTESDLTTRQTDTLFIPSDLPNVTAVRFEGNRVFSSAALKSATARLIAGGRLSVREARKVVELNLRPLYQERGYLTVAFPSMTMDGSVAVFQILEGPQWILGRVSVEGDALPVSKMLKAAAFAEGKPANWRLFQEGVRRMEGVLKHDGYVAFVSKPTLQFRDGQIVDVRIDVRKTR